MQRKYKGIRRGRRCETGRDEREEEQLKKAKKTGEEEVITARLLTAH